MNPLRGEVPQGVLPARGGIAQTEKLDRGGGEPALEEVIEGGFTGGCLGEMVAVEA